LFDADELLRRPPAGALRPLVLAAVAASCLLTVVVMAVGGDSLMNQLEWSGAHSTLDYVLRVIAPFVMFLVLGVALIIPTRVHRLSRAARVAVMLPFAHLALAVGAALISTQIDRELVHRDMPMLDTLPMIPTFFGLALLVGLAARLIPRRREQMHGLVMVSLAFLCAFGLWLPIAAHLWSDWGIDKRWWSGAVEDPSEQIANWVLAVRVIAVPFVAACTYSIVELRYTEVARRWRPVVMVVALGVFLGGASARYSAAHPTSRWTDVHVDSSLNVYANFIHVLLIAVVLAFVSLAAFVVAQRRERDRRAGTLSRRGRVRVSHPDADTWRTPAGSVEITSWLRPPRTSIGAFTLVTENGDIPIPPGATLGGALPLATTILFNGEGVVVLRDGDEIEVEGLVEEQAGESPFRSASMLVPGPAGVVVRTPNVETRGSTVLALWRPSLAYMAIAAAVALSAIAGASN
jgi:hypothetical protein